MVESLIDDNTLVLRQAEKDKVALIKNEGKIHIVSLNQLSESDLRKLKNEAYQNLSDLNAVLDQIDQIYEIIRRINTVLDIRTNNAACLTIQSAQKKEMIQEAMSSARGLGICLIITIVIIVGCIVYFVS